MIKEKILIIIHSFPPYNVNIGARRWAKFSKFLILEGFDVYVLTSDKKSKSSNSWNNDIKGVKLHYFKNTYPAFLSRVFTNRFTFPLRVIQYFSRKITEHIKKGVWMDEALFSKKNLLKEAKEIIRRENITSIISSGPPHRINLYASQLKNTHPQIKLIIDYRDSWYDAKNYGYTNMPKYLKRQGMLHEAYAFSRCEKILCVNEKFIEEINQRHKNSFKEKLKHIPHLIDDSDYPGNNKKSKNEKSNILITYGGTVTSSALAEELLPFFAFLKKNKLKAGYERLKIRFYTSNESIKHVIPEYDLREMIEIHDLVNEEKLFESLNNSDYLLALLSHEWKDYITTKQIVYLPFRKPFILLSKPGKASEMIESNKLGYTLTENNYDDIFNLILNDSHELEPITFDYKQYTYQESVKTIKNILQSND